MRRRVRTGLEGWLCALVWWGFLTPLVSSAAEEAVTASLDRNIISLGEQATLTLSFNNLQPGNYPPLPPIPNVSVNGVGRQSSVTIVNSERVERFDFLYTLTPTGEGEVLIPSMRIPAGGKVFTTQPLKLTVTKSPPAPTSEVGQVRLLISKNSIYLGEALPCEIDLYVQAGRNPTSPQLAGDGFTVGSMEQQQIRRVRLDNQIYNLVPFKTFVLAAKIGRLTLGPASITLDVPAPNARRTLFGEIADWRRVTLASETLELEVKPLPKENVPPTFNGAVGHYTMAVSAGPTNLSVGDPITVRVRLTGEGSLDGLQLPQQPGWSAFQTYPPNSSVESSDPHHLNGVKNFEQVVIPQDDQISVLPALQFSYFDLASASYQTLRGPSFPLKVRSAAHTPRDVPALTNANPAAAEGQAPEPDDILHIKPRLEAPLAKGIALLNQSWFLCLQAVPLLAWGALRFKRGRREAFLKNPRRQRQREVSARVRQGLVQLRQHAQQHAADQFFMTLFRLLQEQLGERLDVPASGITESVIDERLTAAGLSQAHLETLHELFQACNQARYAPQASSAEFDALIGKTELVLRQLQSLNI